MFVRWKKRKLMKRRMVWTPETGTVTCEGRFSLTAQLVETQRVDGKPRQKVIMSLATFNPDLFDSYNDVYKANAKDMFWKRVGWGLDAVGKRLTPEDREKIEKFLEQEVPKPTEAELAKKPSAKKSKKRASKKVSESGKK